MMSFEVRALCKDRVQLMDLRRDVVCERLALDGEGDKTRRKEWNERCGSLDKCKFVTCQAVAALSLIHI